MPQDYIFCYIRIDVRVQYQTLTSLTVTAVAVIIVIIIIAFMCVPRLHSVGPLRSGVHRRTVAEHCL